MLPFDDRLLVQLLAHLIQAKRQGALPAEFSGIDAWLACPQTPRTSWYVALRICSERPLEGWEGVPLSRASGGRYRFRDFA